MASKELQKLLESIRAAGSFDGDLMTMRKMMSRAPAYPKPEDITWEPVDASGVPAEWVIPDDRVPGRAVVYLHGGGYATGTLDSARPLFSHLARATRAPPARRGLPARAGAPLPRRRRRRRHGVPLRHLGRPRTARPSRSAVTRPGVAWRSQPSSRSATSASRCQRPAICMSPWTDLTLSGPSLQANRDTDPMVSAATLAPHGRCLPRARSIGDRRRPPRCSRI